MKEIIKDYIETRIREGNKVEIVIGEEENVINSDGHIKVVTVPEEEYAEALKILERAYDERQNEEAEHRAREAMFEARRNEASRADDGHVAQLEYIVGNNRKGGGIKKEINIANNSGSTRTHMQQIKKDLASKSNKKEIKGTRKQENNTRFKVRTAAFLVAMGMLVGGAGVATFPTIKENIDEAKQESFQKSLDILKQAIAESVGVKAEQVKVYNKSSELSSVSDRQLYIVEIGGEKYTYDKYIADGAVYVERDEIKNQNIIKAIYDISNAEEGTVWKCMEANKTAQKIANGKMNVSMEAAIEARENEKEETRE